MLTSVFYSSNVFAGAEMKILLIICCIFLVGCMKDPGNTKYVNSQKQDVFAGVVSYGQEVYYFGYAGADFGNTLAAFLKKFSDLEVAGMAVHTGSQGSPEGYFVVLRPKKKE